MLEIGVFGVILLAAGYWTTMFIMGRRDDVLHGKFVRFEEQGDPAGAAMPAPLPRFPGRPAGAAPQPQAPEQKTRSADSAALESLLAAIQQDLKSVA